MNSMDSGQPTFLSLTPKFLLLLCISGTILLIGWPLSFGAYGIDFTDESYYLVVVSNPHKNDGWMSNFGFIYHPLYSLFGGAVSCLRQANILITLLCAFGLTLALLELVAPEFKRNRITFSFAAAGLAMPAMAFFDAWLATPSYNSLAFQGLLVTSTGLIILQKDANAKSLAGWGMLGVGGWLVFMAKPSAALALSIGAFAYLLLSRKFSFRLLGFSLVIAAVLLLLSAFWIDGSVPGFIERLRRGMAFRRALNGGYTLGEIFRIDSFNLNSRLRIAILLIFSLLSIGNLCFLARDRRWKFMGVLVAAIMFLITAVVATGQVHRVGGFGPIQGLMVFGLVYSIIFSNAFHRRMAGIQSIGLQGWALAAFFLCVPHIYAFGTNGNYWAGGSSAAIFWLLAGVALMGPLVRAKGSWCGLLLVVICAQTATAALVQTGLEQPYRQPQPLRLNKAAVEFGDGKTGLLLSGAFSKYVSDAVEASRAAGFEASTPVLDLSGQSPGILFAMKASNIGQPWTLGGYTGSLDFVKAGLDHASCEEIARAWILTEPDGPRSISTELLQMVGSHFPDGYRKVAEWRTAEGAGGYDAARVQMFYKPIDQERTIKSCAKMRTFR